MSDNNNNNNNEEVEDHYLDAYLSEILPALGLDAETYAPYVTGYANEEEEDDDALDELIELLKASSETHGEDEDDAWHAFRKEIVVRREEYVKGEDARKELNALKLQESTNIQLKNEIELSNQHALEMAAKKQRDLQSQKLENMSQDKLGLMARFGYEDSTNDTTVNGDNGEAEQQSCISNKEHATSMHQKNTQKQRTVGQQSTQSKAEARLATKQAKAEKLAKKEARRKKAGKQERHR